MHSDRRGSMIGKPKELKLYLSSQDQTVNGQASEVMSRCWYLPTPGLFLARYVFLCLQCLFWILQNVFSRMKNIVNASSVGAILCGHKQMTEVSSSTCFPHLSQNIDANYWARTACQQPSTFYMQHFFFFFVTMS